MVPPITLVPIMALATIPPAITGVPTDMPIIDIRIGAIDTGAIIAGITIEWLDPKMNC
jgi:hypothetical protein